MNATSFNSEAPFFTQEMIQFPGPLINGTFNIMAGNEYINYTSRSIDFPPSLYAYELENILKRFFNHSEIVVTENDPFPGWQGKFGKTWIIQYNNPPTQFPDLTFVTDKLYGGAPFTSPEITFESVKGFSNSLVYNPLSFELMRTFSTQPAVVVEVNNIMSMCVSSCEFFYLDGTP